MPLTLSILSQLANFSVAVSLAFADMQVLLKVESGRIQALFDHGSEIESQKRQLL